MTITVVDRRTVITRPPSSAVGRPESISPYRNSMMVAARQDWHFT
ncbi:hypothetical protein J2S43_005345 [Catenuloplanes nepalensis]|uniref:Uncharacterized protein n=1 Tax=Catenuloplanes nepalensis TaxID=587533 RepID=A0ABT9N010_9ACTN|nr:hypothetical protein [Catenuloplanes nepalensis]MDP9796833.1 hypothetical protein [Catenuloplanes nepalensis]